MDVMMQVAAVGVTAVILCGVLRRYTPELAVVLALGMGATILFFVVNGLNGVMETLQELTGLTGMEEELLRPIVKTVALSLTTRITAELCRGGGESGIAAFVETAGAVLILGVSLPLMRAVMVLMGELLG